MSDESVLAEATSGCCVSKIAFCHLLRSSSEAMQAQAASRASAVQAAPSSRAAAALPRPPRAARKLRSSTVPRVTGQARAIISALGGMAAGPVAAAATASGRPSGNRLLIVGPGVLGSYAGKLWLDVHGEGCVVGQTNSTTNHAKCAGLLGLVGAAGLLAAGSGCPGLARSPCAVSDSPPRLAALGITPRTKDAAPSGGAFPYMLFAAPPSGSDDYLGELKAALALWDGTGAFVFTSSAGVYTVEDGSGGCWQRRGG